MASLLPNGEYWVYLRKSRADLEAEARGEGETLSKHRRALFRFAKENGLTITRVFSEVASGETIFHRPEMVKLLQGLETEPPAGVLVMDIERFGRGDKIDQGMIERAFKESGTLIVTPVDVYDMRDEAGEFNVEVRSFLARMELKQTTKRMQGGRIRSVENDRNYIATRPPYGYLIHKENGSRTLVPHPEQASVVKQIFEWYNHSDPELRKGSNKIANQLNLMQIPTYTGKQWESSAILNILKNAVYAGRLQWKKKEQKKSRVPGKKRDTRTRPVEEWIDVEGKHEPLITMEMYQRAQELLKGKYHVPYQIENGITNPLAGLIRCAQCGSSMVYRPYTTQPAHIMCANQLCKNKSSRFEYVEGKLIEALGMWLKQYKDEWSKRRPAAQSVSADSVTLSEEGVRAMRKELAELESQKGKLHDFLERGIYSEEVFLSRSQELSERIKATNKGISRMEQEVVHAQKRQQAQKDVIPKVESAIKLYVRSKDPAAKNAILKDVLQHAVYNKEKWQRNDQFTLTLVPRLPK